METMKVRKWIKKNKRKIVLASCVIISSALAYKYRGNIMYFTYKLLDCGNYLKSKEIGASNIIVYSQETVKKVSVHGYVRNLPTGYHSSTRQLMLAKENGIVLNNRQTFVSSHVRCYG